MPTWRWLVVAAFAASVASVTKPQDSTAFAIDAAIAPSGSAGYGEDRNRWTLGVSVGAWRGPNGVVVTEDLFLTRPGLREPELIALRNKLPALALVRLQLRAAPEKRRYESGVERWEATLEAVVTTNVRDAALAAWVEEMRKPVVIRDDVLGSMTLDRALSWYQGSRIVDGGTYTLAVMIEEPPDVARDAATLEALRARVEEIEAQVPRYRESAADELLTLYNEEWRDEELPRLTREEFMARLRVHAVHLQSDGRIDVYFDDDDLFAGHVIHVRLEAPDRVLEVGIAG